MATKQQRRKRLSFDEDLARAKQRSEHERKRKYIDELRQRGPEYRKKGMPAMAALFERRADEMENQIKQETKATEGELS